MTPGGAPDDAVAGVSTLAAACVARAAPVRFGVAVSAADLEAVYRLRCGVAVARGWTPAHAFPDGLERDAHDAAAMQVAGWDRDRVVATGRLVRAGSGHRLPTEAAFDMTLSGREQLVDLGRVCVASTYRDSAHRVFRGLLGQIWCEMRRLGCQEAATVVTGPGPACMSDGECASSSWDRRVCIGASSVSRRASLPPRRWIDCSARLRPPRAPSASPTSGAACQWRFSGALCCENL